MGVDLAGQTGYGGSHELGYAPLQEPRFQRVDDQIRGTMKREYPQYGVRKNLRVVQSGKDAAFLAALRNHLVLRWQTDGKTIRAYLNSPAPPTFYDWLLALVEATNDVSRGEATAKDIDLPGFVDFIHEFGADTLRVYTGLSILMWWEVGLRVGASRQQFKHEALQAGRQKSKDHGIRGLQGLIRQVEPIRAQLLSASISPAEVNGGAGASKGPEEPQAPAQEELDLAADFFVPFPQNKRFVSRTDELQSIYAHLTTEHPSPMPPVMLMGMGGTGKTQLAVEFAYRYRSKYAGGIYWVNAADDWEKELVALAERIGLSGQAGSTSTRPRVVQALQKYLDSRPNALVVFDNVADPRWLQEPVLGVVPAELKCRVLMTTRRRMTDLPFAAIEVRELAPMAAVELLLKPESRAHVLTLVDSVDYQAANLICRTLGGLPLAIALASAYLGKHSRIALADYLERLLVEGALPTVDASGVDSQDLSTRHDAAIGATLRLQWSALKHDVACSVLQTASLLREAIYIPRRRLALLTGLTDVPARGHVDPLEDALKALHELSLMDGVATNREVRVHPLVREFTLHTLDDRLQLAQECISRLAQTFHDVGRLNAEVVARGIDEVIVDLASGLTLDAASSKPLPSSISSEPAFHTLKEIHEILDFEAHALRDWKASHDPTLFLQQFRNRCFERDAHDLQHAAESALDESKRPHLRERMRVSRASLALLRTLHGHDERISGVAIDHRNQRVISSSYDQRVKVWDIVTGRSLRTFGGHRDYVTAIAMADDGRLAISASLDKTVRIWNLITGLPGETISCKESPLNCLAITADGKRAVAGAENGDLLVLDFEEARIVSILRGHRAGVESVAMTPDGHLAISGSADKTVVIWDLLASRPLRKCNGHDGEVHAVAISADGRIAVSGADDKTLIVWDVETGSIVRTIEGHEDTILGVAITPPPYWIASSSKDHTLRIWDLETGLPLHCLLGHTSWVSGAVLTADRSLAISSSFDRSLNVWNLNQSSETKAESGHEDWVSGVAITPDGRRGASSSVDGSILLWDFESRRHTRTLRGQESRLINLTMSSNGTRIASLSDKGAVAIWDASKNFQPFFLEQAHAGTKDVAMTPDGRYLLTGSVERTLTLWDLESRSALRELKAHDDQVTSVAISADGSCALSGSSDKTVKLWDLRRGALIHELNGHEDHVLAVAMDADCALAISSDALGCVRVWDLREGELQFEGAMHMDHTFGLAISPDGTRVVTASQDHTLAVWDPHYPSYPMRLFAESPLRTVAMTPDGNRILVGDDAGSVHLLDVVTPRRSQS